jgi:hypothetical protein
MKRSSHLKSCSGIHMYSNLSAILVGSFAPKSALGIGRCPSINLGRKSPNKT